MLHGTYYIKDPSVTYREVVIGYIRRFSVTFLSEGNADSDIRKVKFLPLLWHLLMLPKQLHILQAKPHLGRALRNSLSCPPLP